MLVDAMVALYRGKLRDVLLPQLWTDAEILSYLNTILNQLCMKAPLIVDATTVSLTQLALLAGASSVALSPKITGIERAKLASGTRPLEIWTVPDMDVDVPGWESTPAAVPSRLITDGAGNNRALLWPPTLAADTLRLTVTRLPLADLTLAAPIPSPEIPEMFHDQLEDGILAKAYLKPDTNTLNPEKASEHEKRWQDKIQEIKYAWLHRNDIASAAAPHPGWM